MSSLPPRFTPASVAHHVDALPAGTRLGEFEIVALLGVGGFGMVYQAFDHSLLRFVAIKEYMPAALAGRADGHLLWVRSSSDEQSFQAGLASFVDEARLLAQFDHPSLVKVFRFWEANHTAYMVMPLYSGLTLKQARAHMRTPPPEEWLRKVLWSVTSALRVLHEGQTLHRDISPDNIFLQDHGPPVLLDLGAARHAISDRDQKHTAVLKVNYAPIEQYTDAASHLHQGPWSDLYSLGAVVHGCLCNDTPLPATLRAIRDRMVSFSRVARTVRKQFGVEYSRPFVDAVSQCLAPQPQDRPQSIDAFLQTMGMTAAPAGLDGFDFRAELGSIWVEPSSKDAQGVAVPMIDLTAMSQPQDSRPQAATVVAASASAPADLMVSTVEPATVFAETVADAGDTQAFADTREMPQHDAPTGTRQQTHARTPRPQKAARHASAPRVARAGHGGRARLVWGMAASLALLVIASSPWWGGRESAPRYTPENEIITELASPAPAPEPAEVVMVSHEAADPASAAMAMQPEAASVAEARPAAVSKPRLARKAAEATAPAPAPAPVTPAPEPAPPPPAPSRPAVPARVPGPDEACEASSFFARPLCIHEQCQKPGLANHPVCVENRRRQEAEERRRQLYSQ